MANNKQILSTSEFLQTMRKTPLGSTTELTFGDAQVLSNAGIDISSYGNESNEYVDELAKEQNESSSWWENLFGTIDNIANAFGRGFVSMFEGIVDLGVTIAGDIGSWFGADTKWAEDFVKYDFAGNLANFTETFANGNLWGIGKMFSNIAEYGEEYWNDYLQALRFWEVTDKEYEEWREKYAYSHDVLEQDTGWFGKGVTAVAEGAGQLVGMYLTAGVGKAAGLASTGAQALSLGAVSAGAAGKGVEEALDEGANIHQATLYGLMTGAVEAGTEALGGIGTDVASGVIGKAALKNATIKKFTSNLGGKMVAGFLSEGLEEVMSDVANPLLKKISYDYDMDLATEYSSGEFWAGLAQSFVVGGLLGGVGEGMRYSRLGKTTINGKAIGQQGAVEYVEYANAQEELQRQAKKLNKTFSQLVEDADIDIAERTNIDQALEQVRTSSELTDSQRGKLENAIKRAYEANTKYMRAQDALLNELESKGITADDLEKEYRKKVDEKVQEIADQVGFDATNTEQVEEAYKNNQEILEAAQNNEIGSFYGEDGNIAVVGEDATTSGTEIVALNTIESIKTSDTDIFNDMMSVADKLMTADEEFAKSVDIYTKEYQRQGKSIDEATQLAKQTAMANRMAAFFANKPGIFTRKDLIKKVINTMDNALAPIERGTEGEDVSPEPMLPTETENPIENFNEEVNHVVRTMEEPELKKKVRVGKANIKSTATWLENIGYQTETLQVKLSNSVAGIENAFRRFGVSQREAQYKTDQVRSATSIAADVSQNGFSTVNNEGKIERTTKGLYNGKDGIMDLLTKEFAGDLRGKLREDTINEGFANFYESLGLYVEQDRLNAGLGTDIVSIDELDKLKDKQPKERKTVFGKWLETRTMPADLLVSISEHFPLLSDAIKKGVALDESTFNSLAHKTSLDSEVELTGDALKVFQEASKYLRLLNQQDIDARLEQIDKEYPFFKEMREEVWKYNRELLRMQYEAGYINESNYEWMKDNYSHYVPTYREMIVRPTADISMSVNANTLKMARGSDLVIKDMFESMQMQTNKIHQKCAINNLIKDLANTGVKYMKDNNLISNEFVQDIPTDQMPRNTDSSMVYYLTRPAMEGNVLTYYEKGEAHSILTTNNIMEGFQSLAGVYNDTLMSLAPMRWVAKAQKLVKNLLTTYNPFFGLRNAIRDLWDASFYSPTGMTSVLRKLPKAYKSVITNDINYQTFVANGGIGTSIMSTSDTFTEQKKLSNSAEYIVKPWKGIERVNEIIEIATRYAQYLATVEQLTNERAKGNNEMSNKQIITRGVYEAHEITLNFSRSGTIGRQINNTFGMFLNANIQGFTKMMRTFLAPKTAKEWIALLLKVLILGLGTQLFNELLYVDDEDYQQLNTSIKNNYYLIKIGDQFLRIPKGRVISAFNAFVTAGFNYSKGDKDAMKTALEYALQANAPIQGQSILSWGFFQAMVDVRDNKTWYGGDIVGAKWDNTRPSEQYEKNTSYIARWLGKITNTSPLKIQYLLDQYTGIVGDILLPMTSDEAGTDKLVRLVKDQYLIDPVEKSKYSSDFYNYREQIMFDKTSGDAITTIQASYLNTANREIKELQDQIKTLDEKDLSASEKSAEERTIRVMINASYKAAIEHAEDIGEALKRYTIDEENIAVVQREVYREILGAEAALRIYNKKVYAKAQCYYKAGVSYDDFYVYYFNMKNFSTKDEVERYVVGLHVSPQLKNLLYALAGWRLSKDKIEVLKRWLKKKGLTDEEIAMIL